MGQQFLLSWLRGNGACFFAWSLSSYWARSSPRTRMGKKKKTRRRKVTKKKERKRSCESVPVGPHGSSCFTHCPFPEHFPKISSARICRGGPCSSMRRRVTHACFGRQ